MINPANRAKQCDIQPLKMRFLPEFAAILLRVSFLDVLPFHNRNLLSLSFRHLSLWHTSKPHRRSRRIGGDKTKLTKIAIAIGMNISRPT
jgi:hypothetical protein